MDEQTLQQKLSEISVPAVRFFLSTGSTNDEAQTWAKEGAAEYSLVFAEEQSSGRGRSNRRWITAPGAGLACSIIIYPTKTESASLALFSPLAALAISQVLSETYGLKDVKIKWPNDVLVQRKKISGILVESNWIGSQAQVVVIGFGLNVTAASIPPADQLLFPATCLENETGQPVERELLLQQIISKLMAWRPRLLSPEFVETWESSLAFKDELVNIEQPGHWVLTGQVAGIDVHGNLRLRTSIGTEISIASGDLHLRPTEKE